MVLYNWNAHAFSIQALFDFEKLDLLWNVKSAKLLSGLMSVGYKI